MKVSYQTIKKNQLKMFSLTKQEDRYLLKLKHCKNKILIKLPFVLDENMAALAGLMPDGSLIKDIRRLYFVQKKDLSKHDLFQNLITELFVPNNKIFMKDTSNAPESYINSTVLCHFLHYILDFNKSDEETRIPKWIFYSPDSVKRAYLRGAFAMEGTIFKSLREIRFISKDYSYAKEIQNLLLKVGINSFLKPRIGGTHNTIQYRVSIYRGENFSKFKEIGFTVPMHVERFKLICEKYKI